MAKLSVEEVKRIAEEIKATVYLSQDLAEEVIREFQDDAPENFVIRHLVFRDVNVRSTMWNYVMPEFVYEFVDDSPLSIDDAYAEAERIQQTLYVSPTRARDDILRLHKRAPKGSRIENLLFEDFTIQGEEAPLFRPLFNFSINFESDQDSERKVEDLWNDRLPIGVHSNFVVKYDALPKEYYYNLNLDEGGREDVPDSTDALSILRSIFTGICPGMDFYDEEIEERMAPFNKIYESGGLGGIISALKDEGCHLCPVKILNRTKSANGDYRLAIMQDNEDGIQRMDALIWSYSSKFDLMEDLPIWEDFLNFRDYD